MKSEPCGRRYLYVAIVCGIGMLAGCASQTAVMPDFRDRPSAISLNIVDERPSEDKTSDIGSVWATSCDLSIYRLADEATVPSRLVLLQRDLEDSLGKQLAGRTIRITRYRIFINKGEAARAMDPAQNSPVGALVAAVAKPSEDTCGLKNPVGGRYNKSEVTTGYSPIIVEITTRMNSSEYRVRSVYSPSREVNPLGLAGADSAAELFKAIRKADMALADQMRVR